MKIHLSIPRHMNGKDVIFILTDEVTTASQIKDRGTRVSAVMGICKIIQELSDGLSGTYRTGIKIMVDSDLTAGSTFIVEEYSGTDNLYKLERHGSGKTCRFWNCSITYESEKAEDYPVFQTLTPVSNGR